MPRPKSRPPRRPSRAPTASSPRCPAGPTSRSRCPRWPTCSTTASASPARTIAPLQQQHADMCEAQGPYACRIISMTRTGERRGRDPRRAPARGRLRQGARFRRAALRRRRRSRRRGVPRQHPGRGPVEVDRRHRSPRAQPHRLARPADGSAADPPRQSRGAGRGRAPGRRGQRGDRPGAKLAARAAGPRRLQHDDADATRSATPGGSFLKPVEGALGSLGSIFGGSSPLIVLGAGRCRCWRRARRPGARRKPAAER